MTKEQKEIRQNMLENFISEKLTSSEAFKLAEYVWEFFPEYFSDMGSELTDEYFDKLMFDMRECDYWFEGDSYVVDSKIIYDIVNRPENMRF